MLASDRRNAAKLLRDNIGQLIATRRDKQKDLADWCGHSEAWISAFLRGERDFRLKDLNRIADFFGLEPYQLLSPGLSGLTERRSGVERRSGHDRRIGHTHRHMLNISAELDRVRPGETSHAGLDRRAATLPAPLRSKIEQIVRLSDGLLDRPPDPRGQAPRARQKKPSTRPDRGTARGPDVAKSE